ASRPAPAAGSPPSPCEFASAPGTRAVVYPMAARDRIAESMRPTLRTLRGTAMPSTLHQQAAGSRQQAVRKPLRYVLHRTRWLFCFLLAACCLLPAALRADDWPQWLGPNRDGVWRETGLIEKFPAGGPPIVWRKPVAGGFAGPAVADGRVIVFDYDGVGDK